jgi:hypothetical protein
MDFEKTVSLYQKIGQQKAWDHTPERHRYNKEKAWYDKVKSKRTNQYYQADELKRGELVPEDWQPPPC